MKFDAYTREQAQGLADALATHVANAAKKELDALRAGVDARIKTLQAALSHPDHAQLIERLVRELSSASKEAVDAARIEAETVAALARGEAQQKADAALTAARAEAQAKIATEQKEIASLRASLESTRQQVTKAQAEKAAVQAAAHAAAQTAQATAEAAAQEAAKAAQAELNRTRSEFEGRLEQVQAARAELARVLADAQREAANARAEATAQAAAVKEADSRVRSLEHEYTELLVARDDASARLEDEGKRVKELTEALAAMRQEAGRAKQEASLSKADAEGRRQGLEAATERIRILEEELQASALGQRATKTAAPAAVAQAATADNGIQLLDHVGTALESIDVAISASEILETLIEQLGRHFARAAVFLVGPSSFKGWRGSGLGAAIDIGNVEIPRTIDSLFTRTLAERKAGMVSGTDGDPAVGVLGSPVATALALPVFANGRVIAIAYAEHTEAPSSPSLTVGSKIAEILIDHANRRLTVKRRNGGQATTQPAPEVDKLNGGTNLDARPPAYSPARQARRTQIRAGVAATLEGSPSVLVDLSMLGAQVLSPIAMRPKRVIRMTLPTEKGEIVCKGRVVWAQFEQATAGSDARYRAGVRFTEADAQALDLFASQHGVPDTTGMLSAKLEESA